MEKRLIISLGLSFVVLYVWTALGPKQPTSPNFKEDSQILENNELVASGKNQTSDFMGNSYNSAKQDAKDEALSQVKTPATTIIPEIESILENDHLNVKFTTKGGNIKEVYIKDYGVTLPLKNLAGLPSYNENNFTLTKESENSVEFQLKTGATTVIKHYDLSKDDYIVQSSIKIVRNKEMSNLEDVYFKGFTLNIPESENAGGFGGDRDQALYEYVIQTENKTIRKGKAHKFSDKDQKMDSVPVKWVGFRDRYFCVIVKPEFETSGYSVENKSENELDVNYLVKGESLQTVSNPEWTSIIYVGPEKSRELKKYDLGFEQIQRYYRFGLFDGIAKIIQGLMHLTHKLIPNWGISIILVSLLIYGCTYPMTIKSMTSMRKMQALQPKMQKIKEKHASNPQKMNQETMALYKTEKVNPLGGCLPMFLQLPVFIGLYQVLWRSVEFKGAKFLWIKDLSEPDRLIVLANKLPLIGTDINILPVLMMGIMFVQQKLSAKNMVTTDPMQAQQQKMMQIIFPIFLGVIFYKFSSGLTLYFTMFYILSTFTQWKLAKKPKVA